VELEKLPKESLEVTGDLSSGSVRSDDRPSVKVNPMTYRTPIGESGVSPPSSFDPAEDIIAESGDFN
jgi:hypothetical protein